MNTDPPEFELRPVDTRARIKAKEPLHSMLLECPIEALEYLKRDLQRYTRESQLDEMFVEVGLTRREFLQQVYIAINVRNGA